VGQLELALEPLPTQAGPDQALGLEGGATWLAMAVRSRRSPALNRTSVRRPTRVITPTVRLSPSGGVKLTGTER
jgi:hypothetical protein